MIPYIFVILLSASISFCDLHFNYCQVGSPGKCLGNTMDMLDIGTPNNNASYILSQKDLDYDSCADLCTFNEQCFMALFRTDTLTCHLFRKISFTHSTSPTTKLFLWNCCDTNVSFNAPNRCPGFWKLRNRSKSDNKIRTSDPLVEFKGISLYQCQVECLNNAICGAVNYIQQDNINPDLVNCQLIIQFPVERLVYIQSDSWITFQWQCSENYVLPKPNNQCTTRIGHSNSGRWIIENTSASLTNTTKNVIYFYTLDYRQCLSNCALYSSCTAAWYSKISYFCVLETENESTCADTTPANNDTFTVYVWQNCTQLSRELKTRVSQYDSCRILIDNTYTYIYPIKCGHLPNDISQLYPCWHNPITTHGTTFSHNLHCQINQRFRVFDTFKTSTSSIFKGFSNVTWLRAYTGYQSFWLVNISDNNFRPTNDNECNVFDSSLKLSDDEPLKIIKRSDWFSSKSYKPENPYSKKPVKYVIITDTEVPFCNCYSVEVCSNVMRRIQLMLQPIFYSIPYSFVIGGDGIAYEGRGWDHEPAAGAGKYNPDSFVVALCGTYKDSPNIASLMTIKKLIKRAIELNKVKEDYILYLYNDIRDRPYPYDGLRRVIELWPHYRGNLEEDCQPISHNVLIIDFVAVIVGGLLICMCAHVFVCRIWHKPHCSLARKCRIERMYGNVYDKCTEVLPQILLHTINDLKLEENYISSFTNPVVWIEDGRSFCDRNDLREQCHCKSEIFLSLDLHRFQSLLINVGDLAELGNLRHCSKTTVFIFERHGIIGNEFLIILHLQNPKSFQKFIFQLYRNKCICDNFELTKHEVNSTCFVPDCDWIVDNPMTEKITKSFRDTVQQKYTFSFQTNKVLSYYFSK